MLTAQSRQICAAGLVAVCRSVGVEVGKSTENQLEFMPPKATNIPKSGKGFHRLVSWTILPEGDTVVSEDIDDLVVL